MKPTKRLVAIAAVVAIFSRGHMAMADHTPSSEELSDASIKCLKAYYSQTDLFNRLVSFDVISGRFGTPEPFIPERHWRLKG